MNRQEFMCLEDIKQFSYEEKSFSFCTKQNSKSKFDELLQVSWEKCVERGYFRYTLNDIETRILPGNYGFVAQLNIKRAIERRKPQHITDVTMPFNPDLFHFGKVSSQEIIFCLTPLHWKKQTNSEKNQDCHVVIINVSPLEYCHSLLVPSIEKCNPQVMTFDALRLAVESMLISFDPTLRIGFNSLGAFASVNHLHFHIYYLKYHLKLETINVKQIAKECYEVINFPSAGFVFQLLDNKVETVVRSVMKLVDYLMKKRIAHNVFITRGTSFNKKNDNNNSNSKEFDAVRIYVWARKSFFGSKNDIAFNPALCELGGHFPIKDRKYFETVLEEEVANVLQCVCCDTFSRIKDDVRKLYES